MKLQFLMVCEWRRMENPAETSCIPEMTEKDNKSTLDAIS